MSTCDYKLTYFAITGLGEPLRWMFAYGGIKYEDDRIPFAKWPEMKQSTPFGQVPLLTYKGKQYWQSLALFRFVAGKVGLVGKNDLEDIEIDAIANTISDLRLKNYEFIREKDEAARATIKDTLLTETYPYYLEKLEKIAEENNGHLACKKLTWADFFFVPVIEFFGGLLQNDLLAQYPNLKAVYKNVMELPAIKEWISKRPANEKNMH